MYEKNDTCIPVSVYSFESQYCVLSAFYVFYSILSMPLSKLNMCVKEVDMMSPMYFIVTERAYMSYL